MNVYQYILIIITIPIVLVCIVLVGIAFLLTYLLLTLFKLLHYENKTLSQHKQFND
ncbi:MAG: hypothetical protein Unbinned4264contig1000_9 [Prokaryotic dsDNA virus sp.]|nr:MAG: hypothetical protein Unbinned4264contig1000_9 [Prokaryotic dsDNA virus sp.]